MSLSDDQNKSQPIVSSDDINQGSDDNNKENTDYSSLKFSEILFTEDSEQSLGLHFAMRPCRERKTVRTLIERGGGYMSSYNLYSNQLINLVTKDHKFKEHQKSSDSNLKLYYLTFVYDSCKANTLLDLNQYLFQKTTTVEKSSERQESETQLNHMNDKQIDNNPNENSCDLSTTQDLSQTNECLEQIDENNVSESDLDIDEESDETKSKYFNANERFLHKRKDKSDNKKKYFTAYLDFIQKRETTNTPENLMRIKHALKASVEEQTNQTTDNQKSQSSLRDKNDLKLSKDMPFGAKVVTKTRNESKKHKESKSQETGYQVSDISSEENSDHQKRDQRINPQMIDRKLKPNKNVFIKQNSNYCLTEDESILEFLVKTKRFDELKGNSLWQEAERQDICEGRTWQSMKERFRKHIIPNIDTYDITKREKKKIKVCYYSTDKNLDTTRVQSGSYTFEEDMAIIRNVINKNGYELVKGMAFWKQTEMDLKQKKVCDRSWQSLKERYLKRIVPSLDKYEIKLEFAKKIVKWTGLSENEQQIVLRKCQKSYLKPKATKQALDIRQVENNQQTEEMTTSDTEVEEQMATNQIDGSSQRSKRIKK